MAFGTQTPPAGFPVLLREVPQDVLMKAIKGTDEALKEKILGNMSKRAAEMLAY